MKTIIVILNVLFFSISVVAQQTKIQKFYVGAYTSEGAKGISYCSLDLETGDVKLEKTCEGIENPSFLRLSPSGKYLYAVSEVRSKAGRTGGTVVAYKVKKDGSLKLINRQSSNGDGPCHVDVSQDGRNVAVACYAGGTTSLYPVNKDGSLKKASSVIVNSGSGPNQKRQDKPHAHSIKFSPYDKQVLGADLGTDKLNIFYLEDNELISKQQKFLKLRPGAGPRHFDFHPNKEVIYVIYELKSSIETIKRNEGIWQVVGNVSTLPESFKGDSYCADIHISKDGRFVYGSNRGHNSIAVFKVNQYNTLSGLKTVSAEGDWPRNFGITPDGNWMLVANQRSNDITVFKINHENGIPEFSGKKIELPSPVCIEFL